MTGCYRDLKFIEVSLLDLRREMYCQKQLGRVGGCRTLVSGTASGVIENLKTKDYLRDIKRSEKVMEDLT